MTRKNVIKICAAYAATSLVIYAVLSLYKTGWQPFLILAITLLVANVIVPVFFYYECDRYLWAFFSWIVRGLGGRDKPPDFCCVRCRSIRVIIHERTEDNYLYRYFWCKDCGYKWSNIELQKEAPESKETPRPKKRD